MGAASLVLGILSLVIAVFGGSFGISWIGTIFAIIGIILGAKAKKIPEQAGLGKGGFICSIIGLILSLLVFIACVA